MLRESGLVTFNVGGKEFCTSVATLCKVTSDSRHRPFGLGLLMWLNIYYQISSSSPSALEFGTLYGMGG